MFSVLSVILVFTLTSSPLVASSEFVIASDTDSEFCGESSHFGIA